VVGWPYKQCSRQKVARSDRMDFTFLLDGINLQTSTLHVPPFIYKTSLIYTPSQHDTARVELGTRGLITSHQHAIHIFGDSASHEENSSLTRCSARRFPARQPRRWTRLKLDEGCYSSQTTQLSVAQLDQIAPYRNPTPPTFSARPERPGPARKGRASAKARSL
jgi:hypothetical protein